MKQPNLFTFAKNEYSQDAFICWLLSWASPEYKSTSPQIHRNAHLLIESFFEKHNKKAPVTIKTIDVVTQDSNIDVLCIINEEYVIIIEDKTKTKDHSGQLAKYLTEIKGREYCADKILPIYLKTYDQSCFAEIKDETYKGYKIFTRDDFLSVLNHGHDQNIENEIFNDFRKHLQKINDDVNSYQTLSIDKWKRQSWIGFYKKLQDELKSGHWDYVPNPSGGFLGFWWHFHGDKQCRQYIQLEQETKSKKGKLCFKISVENSNERKSKRNHWYKSILSKTKDYNLSLSKPLKFGSGTYMTVLVADDEYRKTDSNGIIDIPETIQHITNIEMLLTSVCKSA